MGYCWIDNEGGKPKYMSVHLPQAPVPLCPSQSPQKGPESKPVLRYYCAKI